MGLGLYDCQPGLPSAQVGGGKWVRALMGRDIIGEGWEWLEYRGRLWYGFGGRVGNVQGYGSGFSVYNAEIGCNGLGWAFKVFTVFSQMHTEWLCN
ncbi:hypothetical protein Tco_0687065 [Tanacetum coccineum]